MTFKSRLRPDEFGENVGGLGRPDKRLGVDVVRVHIGVQRFDQFQNTAEHRSRLTVRSRKKRSTMLSQEELVGVK